jgi:hypothetical protein
MDESAMREIRWRDYALNAQLYQFYIDQIIKVNILYYGITGGILSFCLTRDRHDYTLAALLLPVVMSTFLAALFAYGSKLCHALSRNTLQLAEKLELDAAHNFSSLPLILLGAALLQFLCAVGIAGLLGILWYASPR